MTPLHILLAHPPTFWRPIPFIRDETLFMAIARQDLSAMSILYDRYANGIYTFIQRMVTEPRTTEALVIETFRHIWHETNTFNASLSSRAWIFRIARTCTLAYLRQSTVSE